MKEDEKLPTLDSMTPGTQLEQEYKNREIALSDYSDSLVKFLSIYPSLAGNYLNAISNNNDVSDHNSIQFTTNLLSKKELSIRLNNFYYYKIVSISKDDKNQEDAQTLRQKSDVTISCLQAALSVLNPKSQPIICYGMACRKEKRFMFLGVQKSIENDKNKRDEQNENIISQIHYQFSSKEYTLEPCNDLFIDRNQNYYSGINFAIPDSVSEKNKKNQNNYNDLFNMDNKKDFTLLILAKSIDSDTKKKYSDELNTIYKYIKRGANLTKEIKKLEKESLQISETNTTQEEKSTVSVINKSITIGGALANQALGAVAGITLAGSLTAIPLVGKQLAVVGLPVLTVAGAFLGGRYLTEMTEPYTKIINETITKKHVDIKSITTTLTKEMGFSQAIKYEEIDKDCETLANEVEKAYNRFKSSSPVWQTIITYSSPEKNLRDTLHSKVCYTTSSDSNSYAYTQSTREDLPEFLIPDNFFRTGSNTIPSEFGNFITEDELSSILYLPTKSFKDEFEIK